jgi:RNA polymerase sigma-70 factor (ECF subfamily)
MASKLTECEDRPISAMAAATEGVDVDSLVRAAQAGDRVAFTQLVQVFTRPMYNLAYRMAGNADDAADLTQEIFVKLYRAIGQFRYRSKFSTWLCSLGANTCRSGMRKLGRRRDRELLCLDDDSGDGVLREAADPGDRPDREMERRETQATIERAIGQLPEAFRTVIILRDLQGMAYDEIAEVVGCSMGTVKSRLARARMRVRDRLTVKHDEM